MPDHAWQLWNVYGNLGGIARGFEGIIFTFVLPTAKCDEATVLSPCKLSFGFKF